MSQTRKEFIKNSASIAALPAMGWGLGGSNLDPKDEDDKLTLNPNWPILESDNPNAPPLCMNASSHPSIEETRRIKQLGVIHVVTGVGPVPWTQEQLNDVVGRYQRVGMKVQDLYISGFDKAINGE